MYNFLLHIDSFAEFLCQVGSYVTECQDSRSWFNWHLWAQCDARYQNITCKVYHSVPSNLRDRPNHLTVTSYPIPLTLLHFLFPVHQQTRNTGVYVCVCLCTYTIYTMQKTSKTPRHILLSLPYLFPYVHLPSKWPCLINFCFWKSWNQCWVLPADGKGKCNRPL